MSRRAFLTFTAPLNNESRSMYSERFSSQARESSERVNFRDRRQTPSPPRGTKRSKLIPNRYRSRALYANVAITGKRVMKYQSRRPLKAKTREKERDI